MYWVRYIIFAGDRAGRELCFGAIYCENNVEEDLVCCIYLGHVENSGEHAVNWCKNVVCIWRLFAE